MTQFIQLAIQYLPSLLMAALTYTLPFTAISFILGLIFAILTALIRIAKLPSETIVKLIMSVLKT